jgi:hypothetical protein
MNKRKMWGAEERRCLARLLVSRQIQDEYQGLRADVICLYSIHCRLHVVQSKLGRTEENTFGAHQRTPTANA